MTAEVCTALREIAALALAEGNTDFAWVAVFLYQREDFATGTRFTDAELAQHPAAENIRVGLRELYGRDVLVVWIERQGRPSMTWTVFPPAGG